MPWLSNGQTQESYPLKHRRWPHKEEVTAQQRHNETVTYMNSSKQNGCLSPNTFNHETRVNQQKQLRWLRQLNPQFLSTLAFPLLEAGPLVGDSTASLL